MGKSEEQSKRNSTVNVKCEIHKGEGWGNKEVYEDNDEGLGCVKRCV